MADVEANFSCSNQGVSRINVTTEEWTIKTEEVIHNNTILAVAIIQTLIIAVGIPWNALVMAFIIFKKHYKETTYILLMNLVVSDLLVCTCVLPFNIASSFSRQFSIGNTDYMRCQVCQTIVVIIVALVFVSLFTLALMSLDRLLYVKLPLQYESKFTKWRVLLVLCAVWVFCILISVPPVFGIGDIGFSKSLSTCSLVTKGETRVTRNINYVVILGFIAAFPFLTTLIANVWLLLVVYKTIRSRHTKRMSATTGEMNDSATLRRNKQMKSKHQKQQILLAQVFGAIFVVNVVTWLPTIVIAVVSAAIGAEKIPVPVLALVYLAYVSQPAVHPILETCLIGKAKERIFRYLCFCRRRSRRDWRSSTASTLVNSQQESMSSLSNLN